MLGEIILMMIPPILFCAVFLGIVFFTLISDKFGGLFKTVITSIAIFFLIVCCNFIYNTPGEVRERYDFHKTCEVAGGVVVNGACIEKIDL